MATDEAVWCYETIKASGSEELNYIVDIVTGGHRPGEAIKDEEKGSN
ncbi:hypothetical protein [Paenibacillus sp. FSL R5-0345]|nr:hypothetical protein [Paenibacillus sp. FSL R5-0345]